MPLRLEIKKLLSSRSDRVKCVDIHPTEPWVLSALYNGHVFIWDYQASSMVKSFEVCQLPVRCARFIVRKQWFITASDDMHIRVFNYNTMEKIQAWEAHTDYIRYLEVHPTLPYVLSASDDMSVKLWDWERQWDCTQVFEGHSHYVMMVKFNLKDSNTFASASLDRTVKVWGLGAPTPHFSLEGHERGVNSIDYYPGGDRPYLLSGSDDRTVKIWDYQTKSCVQTLEGHTNNVSAVLFHKRLPIIVSAGEDGTVRLWHSTTYRAETTLNYGMERVWALAASPDNNKVAIGFDEGTVVLKLGHEMPVASLDTHTGKVVWALNSEIQTTSLKGLVGDGSDVKDGERLAIVPKDLGSTELYPQVLKHNCNGRFLVVCGDGEYIIYTSQALRNKSFGSALDFVWSSAGTGDYAIRETITRVKTFKNFKEQHTLRPPVSSAEGLFGGACLGVKGADCVVFFDWDEGVMIRKIDVVPKEVYWSDNEDLCLLACQDNYYVLRYHAATVEVALQSGNIDSETGVDASFELVHEMTGKIRTGQWVGDCFLFTNEGRLSYYIGGETMTLCHLEHPMYMLGYLPKEDRVYLMDKQQQIYSYRVRQAMLQYQTAVVRKDFETANSILPSIPKTEYTAVARFLESQGFKAEAFQVSLDPEHKFDLALELGKLGDARTILDEMPQEEYDTTDAQSKWKRLGDLALAKCDLALVERCAVNAQDLGGLLLLHSSTGNREGMLSLAEEARKAGRTNVAFLALFVCGKVEECLELLVSAGRVPEAAFMARTYLPSAMGRLVALWKKDLATVSAKASQALADPVEYPNMFDDLDWALKVEDMFRAGSGVVIPAAQWPTAKDDLEMDLVQMLKDQAANGTVPPTPPAASDGDGNNTEPSAAAADTAATPSGDNDSSMITMAGTPTPPTPPPPAAAARVGGGVRSSGVMKEDGETFEEPPEVTAASAAASASMSGTEAREDLDVELELQAAAAAQRSDLGSSSEGGGGGSRNGLTEYEEEDEEDEDEEEEDDDAEAEKAAAAAAAAAAEAVAAAEAAEAARAKKEAEDAAAAAAAAEVQRYLEQERQAAAREQERAEAAARQQAQAEAAKKKAVEDARQRAEAAAQAARLAAEEEARLAEEEEAALLAEAEAAAGGGGKADDEDSDLDDDFGDEW